MYYESVDSRFHTALWSCKERFMCYMYNLDIQSVTNQAFSTGPHNGVREMYVLPLLICLRVTVPTVNCM